MKPFESFGFVGKADYGAFVRFNILKGKYFRVKTMLLAFVLTGAVIALAIVGLNTKNRDLLIAAGVLLLCAAMAAYVIKINVKNVCAKNAHAVKGKQHVLFGKNGVIFELIFDKSEENEYTDVLYDELDNIYETKRYYYIYIDGRTVIIVPKRNLRITVEEADSFLKSYVPEKYVICV